MSKCLREKAMDYLARREHSRYELLQKLQKQEASRDEIDLVLDQLIADNLQSDVRFAEHYVRSRVMRGYGPVVVQHELSIRGVDDVIIEKTLSEAAIDWVAMLQDVWRKKFANFPSDVKDKARQFRFLSQRGFSSDMIGKLLNNKELKEVL